MTSFLLLVVACGDSSEPVAPTPEAPSETELDPLTQVRDRLSDPPQKPGEIGRAYVALAKTLGVGAVHCPSAGAGRVRRIYGTPRDRPDLGIAYRLAQPNDPVPWSPYFEEVAVEDGWVVFLAEPGSTSGYLQATPIVQTMQWPAAESGKMVRCSSVDSVSARVVAGRIETPQPGVVDGTCGGPPVQLGKDGTFVVEAQPPCSLWLLTKTHRSKAISVPGDGADRLDLGAIPLEPDTYQLESGAWTDAGRTRLTELIELAEADAKAREDALEKLTGQVAGSAMQFWRGTLHTSRRDVDNLRRMLLPTP